MNCWWLKWLMEIDISSFRELGYQVVDGVTYRIVVNQNLSSLRIMQLEEELFLGKLELKGHVYVPETRNSLGRNTMRAIDFLRGKTNDSGRVMEMDIPKKR